MSLMTAIEVSASGLTAQRRRLEVLISNLVNANTTRPAGTEPYRRKDVVFTAAEPQQSFESAFGEAMGAVQGVEQAPQHRAGRAGGFRQEMSQSLQ